MNKPPLSFWQIWNMSFGFMGIQFGWGLQMANMSPIYEMLGAREDQLALLWVAAPLTGLIVQPIVGHMSDRTWGRFGRRRPYFFIGALLASLALIAMPNSGALWMAVGLLWVLDASINISMEPFRAFVADMLPEKQRAFGFSVQTLLIGIGAVVSSALPWVLANWFDVSNEAPAGQIPDAVKLAFYMGAAILFVCVMVTILTTKEYPPEDEALFHRQKKESAGLRASIREIFAAIAKMPPRMRQLAWVQLFTWGAMFCLWTYFAPAIARTAFGAVDATSPSYSEGAAWAGVCFASYNVAALLSAFGFMLALRRFHAKQIHIACLSLGAAGLMSVPLITEPTWLLAPMLGVGIAWASILAMPYALLAGCLPANKMGTYMGIFNFFIVIPQVIVALCSGFFMRSFFDGQPVYMLLVAGASMAIAAALTRRITL